VEVAQARPRGKEVGAGPFANCHAQNGHEETPQISRAAGKKEMKELGQDQRDCDEKGYDGWQLLGSC